MPIFLGLVVYIWQGWSAISLSESDRLPSSAMHLFQPSTICLGPWVLCAVSSPHNLARSPAMLRIVQLEEKCVSVFNDEGKSTLAGRLGNTIQLASM